MAKHHKPTVEATPTPQPAAAPETSGFKLPDPSSSVAPPSANPNSAPTAVTTTPIPQSNIGASTLTTSSNAQSLPSAPVTDTESRDLAIGSGVLVGFLIIVFFAKNSWANHLVEKRMPPRLANASGWWLFILIGTLATSGMLYLVNDEKFLTPICLAALGIVSLLSLVMIFITSRR